MDVFPITAHAPTLADLLDAYTLDYLPTLAPSTQRHYRYVYTVLCAPMRDLPLLDVTPFLLKAWRRLLSRSHKPATVRAYMAYLSGAFTAAVDDYEWLEVNPMRQVKRPSKPAGRVRFLSEAEHTALMAACQESQNPALVTIVLLTLATGGRKDEVRCLPWSAVDLTRGLVSFLVTKGKRPRSVPLAPAVVEMLRQHQGRQTSPWVFPNASGLRPMVFERAWRTARKRAGLADFKYHDLRHSAASYLARSGASIQDIQLILGHASITETMRYVHLVPSHTRGVIEKMTHMFLQAL